MNENELRRNAYYTLCSHYRRWLAHSVRISLAFTQEHTDDRLASIKPKTLRAVGKALIEEADKADRECMAVWHMPIDRLEEFVRVRTHPELEKLMLEQCGMVWDSHFANWIEAPKEEVKKL